MKRIIKISVLIQAFSCFVCTGQSSITDTIRIKEVHILAGKGTVITTPFGSKEADSSMIAGKKFSRMTDLLSETVRVYTKRYGPGGLSTVSLRGTTAVHTTVTWNGLSLSSPMAGQTDITLIPVLFADRVNVEYGGASLFSGSGSFGGNLSLSTLPRWNTPLEISLSGLTGSFGRMSGNTRITTGSGNFSYSARIFSEKAKNNYSYLNYALYPEPVKERRRNAETSYNSVLQEAYFRKGKSLTSASIWLQKSDRNLPSSILVSGTGLSENQKDESVRAVASHKITYGKMSFDILAGTSYERLKYVNNIASVTSDNKSIIYTLKGSNDLKISNILGLRFFISEEYSSVRSVNYEGGRKSKNLFSTGSALSITPGNRTAVTLLIRETAPDNKLQVPDYTAGWNFFLSEKRNSWIRANISGNSRIPTLNDLYWVPGGNPDIRNEYCHSGEMNTGFNLKRGNGFNMNGEVSMFRSFIRDMIQWLPGNNGYWSPSNIRDVKITGSEINYGISGRNGSISWKIKGNMSYTKSVYMSGEDGMKGKQLIYVPEFEWGGGAGVKYRSFFGEIDAAYTGKRFTSVDNTRYLKPFALVNFETGVDLIEGKHGFTVRLKLENLTDVNYELVSYFPMQGLSYFLSFEYRFGK